MKVFVTGTPFFAAQTPDAHIQRVAAAEVYARTGCGASVGKLRKTRKVVATPPTGGYHPTVETDYSNSPGNLDGLATSLADLQLSE